MSGDPGAFVGAAAGGGRHAEPGGRNAGLRDRHPGAVGGPCGQDLHSFLGLYICLRISHNTMYH